MAALEETVPVFTLYGEKGQWPTPDLLHCESIAERSRLHAWRIAPHRHTDLTHILHVRAGDLDMELEGERSRRCGPGLVIVPPMVIHGFKFSPAIHGTVITLAEPLRSWLRDILGDGAGMLDYPLWLDGNGAEAWAQVTRLNDEIVAEYRGERRHGRDAKLNALTCALVVELQRLATARAGDGGRAGAPTGRGHTHLQRYRSLLEIRFRDQPRVATLASELGLTPTHLNLLCRRITGRTARQILHDRLVLEAKRQLIYTNMGIGQVSDYLGFSEPAYFSRFFRRCAGQSPRRFRAQWVRDRRGAPDR